MKIQQIKKRFLLKIDELNAQSLQEDNYEQAKQAFEDILVDAYIEGYAGIDYLLGVHTPVQHNKVVAVLDKTYGDKTVFQTFAEYWNAREWARMEVLIKSEFHRLYCAGQYDNAMSSGLSLKKRWITMLDDKVRDTHSYLEGITIPIDGVFSTYDGDYARFPGDFQLAQNNANCRCIVIYEQ